MALTLRTDSELETALDALVQAEGTSRQEVIRRAIIERFDLHQHNIRVEVSTGAMTQRWGDVLDRLGTV